MHGPLNVKYITQTIWYNTVYEEIKNNCPKFLFFRQLWLSHTASCIEFLTSPPDTWKHVSMEMKALKNNEGQYQIIQYHHISQVTYLD